MGAGRSSEVITEELTGAEGLGLGWVTVRVGAVAPPPSQPQATQSSDPMTTERLASNSIDANERLRLPGRRADVIVRACQTAPQPTPPRMRGSHAPDVESQRTTKSFCSVVRVS